MPFAIEDGVKQNKMKPEFELVLFSARTKSPQNDKRIIELLGRGVNWSEILACAIQHKLAPTLYERIRALDSGSLAEDQREILRELARSAGRNSLVLMGEMLRLHSSFATAQIPAIPFKGPALARLAYPNFAQRFCVDLDFVVPQRYIPETVSLLQANGYVPQFSAIEARVGQRGPAPGQYAFVSSGRRIFVEIHTERTLRYFSRPLNLDQMNSRLIHLKIGGQTLPTFSIEDLLVMLCVHGAKHFWERLAWIVDIAELITNCEVDWPLLSQLAAKMKATRLTLLGLYLAHEVIGASLPQSVLEHIRGDTQVQWLARKVLKQYAENSEAGIGLLPRALFRFRSCDGYAIGLRQLCRLSMSPTETDREKMPLPGFLSPLHTVVRLFRLLREYGLGLNRRSKPDLAVYQPTPPEIVNQMLSLADISPGDVLYDLGCGDGRIVVAAAEKYGIRAVGVDINPKRIKEARANARRHGVERSTRFILGDAKKADFMEATVVTMYLGADGNLRLVDQLRTQLRSGARVVSRDFQIYGWEPDRTESGITSNGTPISLYLWTIKNSERASPETTCAHPGAVG